MNDFNPHKLVTLNQVSKLYEVAKGFYGNANKEFLKTIEIVGYENLIKLEWHQYSKMRNALLEGKESFAVRLLKAFFRIGGEIQ